MHFHTPEALVKRLQLMRTLCSLMFVALVHMNALVKYPNLLTWHRCYQLGRLDASLISLMLILLLSPWKGLVKTSTFVFLIYKCAAIFLVLEGPFHHLLKSLHETGNKWELVSYGMGIKNEFSTADIHTFVLWLAERTELCSTSQWSSWQDKQSVWINVLCSN